MKTSFTILLLALLCASALSAFKAKKSVTLSGVTYSIGNNGNDCGVTRTESGTTISWYYTDGAANSDDCVGRNIFVLGSDIGVLLTISDNQSILVAANSATGNTNNFFDIPPEGYAIILGYIDTSSASGAFGKFSQGLTDVSVDFDAMVPAPIEYVSSTLCDDKISIELTVNVESPYRMMNIPEDYVEINGKGVKHVFNSEESTLTAYKAADAPFCTESKETTTTVVEEKSSGIAPWKLALIIALPCVAILTVITIVLYFKTADKRRAAAKMEKFKQLPSSPTMNTEGADNVV